MVRYSGVDFSSNWKVVTYEGKTISFVNSNGKVEFLTGFNGYKAAAKAAAVHGGVPVRG